MKIKDTKSAIECLWIEGFFKEKKNLKDIKVELSNRGVNYNDPTLSNSLRNSKILTRKGISGKYFFIQKHPYKVIGVNTDVFPDSLIKKLGKTFESEINDLRLNYGNSGTCTSFLLRKILEKLLVIVFKKNKMESLIKDSKGDFIGLDALINKSISSKIGGSNILTNKTAYSIKGIKFLGDTSAHNPLVNVDMKTIEPQMPFVVTAYEELSNYL